MIVIEVFKVFLSAIIIMAACAAGLIVNTVFEHRRMLKHDREQFRKRFNAAIGGSCD
jgi:hypothetical protein